MRFLLLGPFILSLFACSSGKRDQYPTGSVQTKIPMWTSSGYRFQVVELQSVIDMRELNGGAAYFVLWPRVSGSQIQGISPQIQTVRNTDGIYIATDEFSLELLTIYYHMEQLKLMDESVGAGAVNTWPRQVAVGSNFYDPSTGQIQNNALYSGQYDSILLMPYTRADLPIAVNAGILGHEHFHSLFQKIVIAPLGSKFPQVFQVPTLHQESKFQNAMGLTNAVQTSVPQKPTTERDFYHAYLLRGLNEGLADFWGWLYSQDPIFVGRSLPEYNVLRRLNMPATSIPDQRCFLSGLYRTKGKNATMKSYEFGTQIAIWMKELSQKIQKSRTLPLEQLRVRMGQALIHSLKDFALEISNLAESDRIEPARWMEIYLSHLPDANTEIKDWSFSLRNTECKRR